MTVSITSISSRSAGEEVCVCFECVSDGGDNISRESFVISAEQYLCLEVCRGVCDTDTFDRISELAQRHACIKKGIFLLGYGACSQKALAGKLSAKGFARETAAYAAEYLAHRGFIDGRGDALAQARTLVKKLWGRRRIISALYEKGYLRDDIIYALDTLEEEGTDFEENCRLLFEKKYAAIPTASEERKKITAALVRYGYTLDQIRKVIG